MSKPAKHAQRGYLVEIPILLMIIGLVAAIVMPQLPRLGQKIFLGVAALPVLFGLYYMIVIPGWTPDSAGRLKPPWSLLVFLLVAVAIISVVVMFAMSA